MKNHRFHQGVWSFLRFILGPWLRHKFNYTYQLSKVDGPCLVMANHDTNWDPLLVALAFPHQMYFVASEHIFRWGFLSKIISFLLAPISRQKGTTAGDTALAIIRRLRKGCNVAMFANGSRSFNGISEDILPSTGKLARTGGATLITYRLDGGYFTEPRWNFSGLRRGKISGMVMNVYSPEMLKSMSVAEINAAIDRDLYVDAYAVQRERMVAYKAKKRAESLESVLCICPHCRKLGKMKSQGNRFFCTDCGYAVEYNEYGFFEGEKVVFDSVTDWDKWQSSRLLEHAAKTPQGSPIFTDSGFELFAISADHKTRSIGSGGLALYHDRLECCGQSFPLEALGGFSLHGPMAVNFSADGAVYELKPAAVTCTRKYQTVIHHIIGQGAVLQS